MKIDGVEVTVKNLPDVTGAEIMRYIEYVQDKVGKKPTSLEIRGISDGNVTLYWNIDGVKFERIRRITGYLTGDLNTWNNAKKSEEQERVKHA